MKYQRGVSLNGLMFGGVLIAVVALLAMKTVPEYMEFGTIVKAAKATAGDPGLKDASVQQVRNAFSKRAEIDNIRAVDPKELDITKEGGELVISFAYERKIPLFYNVSLLLNFEGASNK